MVNIKCHIKYEEQIDEDLDEMIESFSSRAAAEAKMETDTAAASEPREPRSFAPLLAGLRNPFGKNTFLFWGVWKACVGLEQSSGFSGCYEGSCSAGTSGFCQGGPIRSAQLPCPGGGIEKLTHGRR